MKVILSQSKKIHELHTVGPSVDVLQIHELHTVGPSVDVLQIHELHTVGQCPSQFASVHQIFNLLTYLQVHIILRKP